MATETLPSGHPGVQVPWKALENQLHLFLSKLPLMPLGGQQRVLRWLAGQGAWPPSPRSEDVSGTFLSAGQDPPHPVHVHSLWASAAVDCLLVQQMLTAPPS